jgi:hypothetical protein
VPGASTSFMQLFFNLFYFVDKGCPVLLGMHTTQGCGDTRSL